MDKKGLQNEKFIREIKKDGSKALKPKNDVGVNVVEKSDLSAGLISGKLIRPRYNEEELLKSVDTTIVELLPRERPLLPDTVLRSVYDEAIQSINDLTLQVESLESQVGSLTSEIESLNATNESLRRELDGVTISKVSSDEQLVVSQESFSTAQSDLQIAIQNSVQEAIQRVSLTARNESQKQELDLLREQLFGRTAQIQAGAESLTETVTINNLTKGGGEFDVYGIAFKKRNGGFQDFQSGEKFEVVNSGGEAVNVTITKTGATSWYNVSPSSFTVNAGEQKIVKLTPNKGWIDDARPTGLGKARNYDGRLIFKTGTDEVGFRTRLRKARNRKKL
jgi:regulator of replication initiation timing